MRKLTKFYGAISLIIMFTFVSIGYAAVSNVMVIEGTAETTPPPFEGVYICGASVVSTSSSKSNLCDYIQPTNFKTSVDAYSGGDSSITYEITVHNNTDVTYWYMGTNFFLEYEDNDKIGKTNGIFITTKDHQNDSSATFNEYDWVPPQTMRTFYVTYRFGSNARGYDIATLINFQFGLHMDAVQDEFLKILNDKTSDNGYYYLSSVFDDKYEKNGTTEIANIGNDKGVFDRLFGENIMVDVDGVPTPVTIMVSRRNVDGSASTGDSYDVSGSPSGCEYTVYITTDSLDGGTVTVHAVSYTCRNGVWYQIGELYEGTCTTNKYDSVGNNGFDVMSWDATPKVYQVTNDISYKVGYEQGTNFDQLDTMEELLSSNDQEFYNAVNNNSGKLLKPVCNILYSYVHSNGMWLESDNSANKFNPGYDELKHAFDAIKPYCYIGNGAQEVKIQNANSLTRAELIQLLEAVQHAYEYYQSVN